MREPPPSRRAIACSLVRCLRSGQPPPERGEVDWLCEAKTIGWGHPAPRSAAERWKGVCLQIECVRAAPSSSLRSPPPWAEEEMPIRLEKYAHVCAQH